MRHRWENKPFEEGKSRVIEKCNRCGLIRTRTPTNETFVGGFRRCCTTDKKLNEQNELAVKINRTVRFFEVN